ncbi:MAG: SDR family NAD(P)-dependent oxidoreductase [Actinomycetota bacterium]
MDLSDRVALVTGGAHGIGRCVVDRLAERCRAVAVFDLAPREEPTASNVTWHAVDVGEPEAVERGVREVAERHGGIDVCVNNAGIMHSEPLVNVLDRDDRRHRLDTWRRVIDVDLTGVFLVTVNVVDEMVSRRSVGVIVNISSVAAQGNPGQSAYSAAKAGVDALTATWGKELGVHGIRAVGIAPGFTETEGGAAALGERALAERVRQTPLRRLGAVDDIAAAVLAVIENDFITATTVQVDGGLVL